MRQLILCVALAGASSAALADPTGWCLPGDGFGLGSARSSGKRGCGIVKSNPPSVLDMFGREFSVNLEPTGLVICEVDGRAWIDKPSKPVEQSLAEIVADVLRRRDEHVERARRWAEGQARAKKSEQERQDAAQQTKFEASLWQNLVALSQRIDDADRARKLLATLHTMPDNTPLNTGESKEDVLSFLAEVLEKNDPLAGGLKGILERLADNSAT